MGRESCLSSYMHLSFPIVNPNNFIVVHESPTKYLLAAKPTDEQGAVNEFDTAANFLDEPSLMLVQH